MAQYWKNASTLIIAAKNAGRAAANQSLSQKSLTATEIMRDRYRQNQTSDTDSDTARNMHQSRHWTEYNKQFDYKILLLKRSSKSSFMSSAFVFPGGKTSSVDELTNRWSLHFQRILNIDENSLLELFKTLQPKVLPPMYLLPNEAEKMSHIGVKYIEFAEIYQQFNKTTVNTYLESMWGLIQHRLSAIRETFEEAGILMCTTKEDILAGKSMFQNCSSDDLDAKLKIWRKTYSDTTFIEMFENLDILPNLWLLNDWGNWLTPVFMGKVHGNRRFDTMFYLTCLQEQPAYDSDGQEIVQDQWRTPLEALDDYKQRKCWMAPPQLLELSRLCSIPSLDELQEFALWRGKQGCELTMPVRMLCSDGMVLLLPGDGLYPKKPDYLGVDAAPVSEQSMEALRAATPSLRRIELRDQWDATLINNVEERYHHLSPDLGLQFFSQM